MRSNKIKDTGQDTSRHSRIDIYWKGRGMKSAWRTYRKPAIPESINSFSDPYKLLLTKFKFKSVEFGNWVNNEWRYNYLVAATISFYDINKVLRFDWNLGLNETIGLAFGSRGSGGALAHFEPGTMMINLTRYERNAASPAMSGGFSSLAHEYGHGLDYFFGSRFTSTWSLSGGRTTDTRFSWLMDGKISVSKLHLLMNEVLRTIIWEKPTVYSKYFLLLKNELNEYWYRHNELFARAFEQYIQYKLEKSGIQNRFLTKNKYNNAVYMNRGHFEKVVPKMDALIEEMRKIVKAKL